MKIKETPDKIDNMKNGKKETVLRTCHIMKQRGKL